MSLSYKPFLVYRFEQTSICTRAEFTATRMKSSDSLRVITLSLALTQLKL